MEDILLLVVLLVCIYILYTLFTPITEPFLPSNIEDTLGKIATTILTPNTWEGTGNPTRLMATTSNPISPLAAVGIQNRYDTALGDANAGPRIDDTSSLLYMVDFCYEKGKLSNPFADSTFATNCGMCMTMGTTITNKTGSNFGIVVYPEDKTYSLNQGLDAVPSAHTATCAPLVKAEGASSNVRSIAINSAQYDDTLAYKQSNSYTVTKGTGNGTKSLECTGSSNNVPYVIKQGFSRVGAWDTKTAPIDYTRVNMLDTTPFAQNCTESNSCTITGDGLQWDMSALCGYPKPKPITSITIPGILSTSLTFVWAGGEYGTPETILLQHEPVVELNGFVVWGTGNPVTTAPTVLSTNYVTYANLTPNRQYTFKLAFSNISGRYPTVGYSNVTVITPY